VQEILLAVDNPRDEGQVKKFADNIVQQLRHGGNFPAIAHQFSQGAGAASGGDIGWIQAGQLAPELNRALIALKPGDVSEPVRSASGYHILGLREMRTISLAGGNAAGPTSVKLQQLFRPFGNAPNKAAMLGEANQVRDTINGCAGLNSKTRQFPAWQWQDLGEVKLADAPEWLASRARDLPVGKPSLAMDIGKGALIIVVCERKLPTEGKVDREAIANQIGMEKLELQARGLLRDLRRDAFLDVRLNMASNG